MVVKGRPHIILGSEIDGRNRLRVIKLLRPLPGMLHLLLRLLVSLLLLPLQLLLLPLPLVTLPMLLVLLLTQHLLLSQMLLYLLHVLQVLLLLILGLPPCWLMLVLLAIVRVGYAHSLNQPPPLGSSPLGGWGCVLGARPDPII